MWTKITWCSSWVFLALASSSIIVLLRAWRGPFTGILTVHSPLNSESAVAVALLVVMILRSTGSTGSHGDSTWRGNPALWLALILAGIIALHFRSLAFPFVSDDYILVCRRLNRAMVADLFTRGGGDGFYRPVGAVSLALTALWVDPRPEVWHVIALMIHLANCLLVYWLARRLRIAVFGSLFAAAVFGAHGTRPEAVAWVAARFDLVAALFFSSALILFLRYHDRRDRMALAGAAICLILALLSKESAYSFPLVCVLLMAASGRDIKKDSGALASICMLEAGLFLYRWSLFGGIGGYADQRIHVLQATKALFWRAWAIFLFPVNWSVEPHAALKVAFLVYVAAILMLARARVLRASLLYGIGAVLALILPGVQLSLVGSDLLGARLYYLPSIGFAILLAFIVDSAGGGVRLFIAASVLLFNAAALSHNFGIWGEVAQLAGQTCSDAAHEVAAGHPIPVPPGAVRGVFFFQNGFNECVQLQLSRAKE